MINKPSAIEKNTDFLGWTNYNHYSIQRCITGQLIDTEDCIAEEIPVVLVYNRLSYVVMLASPTNLAEFGLGFSLTEGIIQHESEYLAVNIYQHANGIEINIKIPDYRFQELSGKSRQLAGRTGCGLCGTQSLKQAIRQPAPVMNSVVVHAMQLVQAFTDFQQRQTLNQLTGAVHAAAWVDIYQGMIEIREDVGRHNALDKLLGWLIRSQYDRNQGFVFVTSRASYEMVQKTATLNIGLLAAISAPTGLAIRIADQANLTLIGFARQDKQVIYTHPQRFIGNK